MFIFYFSMICYFHLFIYLQLSITMQRNIEKRKHINHVTITTKTITKKNNIISDTLHKLERCAKVTRDTY